MNGKVRFFNKLDTKFTLIIDIVLVFLLVIFSTINFHNEKKQSFKEYSKFTNTTVKGVSKDLKNFLFQLAGTLHILAENYYIKNALTNPEDSEAIEKSKHILKKTLDYSEAVFNTVLVLLNSGKSFNINGINIEDGDFLCSIRKGSENLVGMSALDEGWVEKILQNKSFFIGRTFRDKITGTPLVSISVPVIRNSKIIGAVELVLKLSYFSENFSKAFALEKEGYFFIINDKGQFISHPDSDRAVLNEEFSKKAASIITQVLQSKKHFVDNFQGIKKHYFQPSEPITFENMEEKWYIGYTLPEKTILASAYRSFFHFVISYVVLFILLGLTVKYFFNFFINKPLGAIVASLKDIATGAGDLTHKLNVKSKDEFYLLASYYNKFVDTIADIIAHVKTLINTVASSSAEVSTAMEETSRTAEEQTSELTEVASTIEELTATGNAISEIIMKNNDEVAKARDITTEGSKNLQSVNAHIRLVKENSSNLSEQVLNFTEATDKIGKILSVINEITDKTHLLALNAAIEAARAGEAGRGFAVVAEEVKKLAEKTTSSTKEINDIIKIIEKGNTVVHEQMEETSHSVDKSIIEVSKTDKIFKEIVNIVDKIHEGAEKIGSSMHEQLAALEKSNDNIQIISSASEETSRAVIEVTTTISNLRKEIETLKILIDKFKTN
jgi:methyl-accepting chemotaxis protein